MLLALSVTAGAVLFASFLFASLFRFVDPAIVGDYHACAGDWHESEIEQCAAGLFSLPQQPVNTYSNLAYLAAGIFTGVHIDTPPAYVFAATMTYLCLGSALYHAFSTRWGGMLDVTAIYVVYASLAVYALAVLMSVPAWTIPLAMFGASGAVAYALSPRYRTQMRLIIALFLGGTYILALLQMWTTGNWAPWPYLAGSVAAFALGYLAWTLDRARRFPLPRWGHGVWHVLTAAASVLVFYAVHLTNVGS